MAAKPAPSSFDFSQISGSINDGRPALQRALIGVQRAIGLLPDAPETAARRLDQVAADLRVAITAIDDIAEIDEVAEHVDHEAAG